MGFQLTDPVYRLVIDEGPFDGVEARMSGLTAGQLVDLTALMDNDRDTEAFGDLFGSFAKGLKDWNIERDNIPVPADIHGVQSLPYELFMELVGMWMSAGGGVDAPLESGSPNGGPQVEAHIPMEPLSPSPPRLPEPT